MSKFIFCLLICSTDPNAIYVTMDLLMTEDEFFGERIVENFAAFFGIPDENIRVAEYRENGRKRDASFTVSAQFVTNFLRTSLCSYVSQSDV